MPDENEQKKERSRISIRIGDAQVELEGTNENIKKLMDKEVLDFTKRLEETTKPVPPSTENTPKTTPKTPEVTPKEKPVPSPSKPSTTSKTPAQTSRVPTIGKTTGKMGRLKIVGRTASIALILICIVLLASLVSVIAIYVPRVGTLESQIAEQNDTIDSLNTQNLAIQSVLSQIASNVSAKDAQIEELTAQLNSIASEYNAALSDLNAIIALGKSGYLFQNLPLTQDQNSSTAIWNDVLEYAGYVTVEAQSTSNTTYAEVIYSSLGVNYHNDVTLGESGGAAFPILPGTVLISIGNTDTDIGEPVNATVTVNYIY
jgi:uncharacterized coiled-coil protein SlyX